MEDTEQIEKYKLSVQLLLYEGDMVWKIMSAFMVVHTLLIGFISSMIIKPEVIFLNFNGLCFIASIFGLFLILPWWGTFRRNTEYYHFRMAQAKHCEPKDWDLLKNDGENFAEGKEVIIQGRKYKMTILGDSMKNKIAVKCLVFSFAVLYLILLISYGPWWLCHCD